MSGFDEKDAPEQDQLLNCMRCGMCLPTCPTYQLSGRERSSPRGRIALMRAIDEDELPIDSDVFAQEMDYCLGCLACVTACPAGVRYDQLLEDSRDQLERLRRPNLPWWRRSLEDGAFSLFEKIERLKWLAHLLYVYQKSGLANFLEVSGIMQKLPLPFNLGKLHGLLPSLPRQFSSQVIPELLKPAAESVMTVGLPVGCVMDVMLAKENEATARVLQRNNCTVRTPCGQGCCGALHAHAGRLDGARVLARKMIDQFEKLELDVVCSNSAGCGNCMKGYGHLLRDDPAYAERAKDFSSKVKDVHEVLVAIDFKPPSIPLPKTLTYHDACHLLHGQGVSSQPRLVCHKLSGHYKELPRADRCCGSAGIYNLKQYETSMELLEDKVDQIESTGCEVVGVANPGCLMQIRYGLKKRGLKIRAEHPIVLLDEAYSKDDEARQKL